MDSVQVDLIVQAITKGFSEARGDITKTGQAAEEANKKAGPFDKNIKMLGQSMGALKTAMAGFGLGLQVVGEAFAFASDQAEKMGRVDVATNIDEMNNSFTGLIDVLTGLDFYGQSFLDWMGDAAVGVGNVTKVVGAWLIQQQLATGVIDQATAEQLVYNLVTDEAAVKAEEQAAAEQSRKDALAASKAATENAAKANQLFAQSLNDIQTANQGQLGQTEQDEGATQDELLAKKQELIDKLQQYTDANGAAIPPAENLAQLQREQALAALEYQQALDYVTQAQGDLATSQAQQLGLDALFNQRLVEGQVAIDQKAEALNKANQAVANASGGVANYTSAIEKTEAELAEVDKALDANAAEHEMASRRIIIAMAMQELQTRKTQGALTDEQADAALLAIKNLSDSWGVADSATVDAQININNAFNQLATGGAVDFALALDEMRKPLATDIPLAAFDFQTATTGAFDAATAAANEGTTPAVDTLTEKLKDDLVGASGDAKKAVDELGEEFEAQYKEGGQLYSYDIGIQSLHGSVIRLSDALRNVPPLPDVGTADSGGGTGAAGVGGPQKKGALGLDFVVPAGYYNDNFLVGVQSGEHVSVTPSGGEGGGRSIKLADVVNMNTPMDVEALFALFVQRIKAG